MHHSVTMLQSPQDPDFQRLMMSSKNRVGQIIEALVTVVTLIALTSWFRIIQAALDDVLRRTRWTCDAIGPTQLPHSLITLDVIDEMRDINVHRCTPVWVRNMGWHPVYIILACHDPGIQ